MMTSHREQELSKDIREGSKDIKEQMKLLKQRGQEMKQKVSEHRRLLKDEIKKLEDVRGHLSEMDDPSIAKEIVQQKQSLASTEKELERSVARLSKLQEKVEVSERELEAIRQQQQEEKANKKYPRARYVVNLFREVSKISWDPEPEDSEVKGFIRGKSSVKTFCFDENKQSRHFITNSLWEMVAEDTW